MLLNAKEHIEKFKLCSVVMPVYNSEKYLEYSIRSVLNQTYRNIELIIIDDCSQDNSSQIIDKYVKLDVRVRKIILNVNQGCANARNRGIDIAKGKYIAFIDSDDVWFKNKLEKQILLLEKGKAELIYTAYNMIDFKGNKIKKRYVKNSIMFDDLLKENSIIFSSVICLKSNITNIKFDRKWYHEDYVFLLNLLKSNVKFLGINEVLVNYRVHNNGRSFNKINAAKHRWEIYRKFLKLGYISSIYMFIYYAIYGVKKYFKW